MAIKKLKEIAEICLTNYKLEKMLIIHRVGEVVRVDPIILSQWQRKVL
jgi:molybdopterin synthase catalytic subunit